MSDCDCSIEVTDKSQNGVLIKLLTINALMFIIELSIGWYAQSTGLIADAMDMLADAIVYGIGLYAVGKAIQRKANAALISGWFQLVLQGTRRPGWSGHGFFPGSQLTGDLCQSLRRREAD